jgi:hypothetical protein
VKCTRGVGANRSEGAGGLFQFGYHAINKDDKNGFESNDDVFGSINRITGKLDLIQKWSYVPRYGEQRNVYSHDYEMSCIKSDKMF